MKVLTLYQPWASLVTTGAKQVETRSWGTRHRGPLAIHAAVAMPKEAMAFCRESEECQTALACVHTDGWQVAPFHILPRGVVVGMVNLVDVVPTEDFEPDPLEAAFGNFEPGRFAWRLEGATYFNWSQQIHATGRQRLWYLRDDLFVPSFLVALSA